MRIGSSEHLDLLCREFIDTHKTFEPAELPWPALTEDEIARLRGLPFWDEAIRTERMTGAKVAAYARLESPALLREAVALQGYEEQRHARLLETMIARYAIAVDPGPQQPLPRNLEAAFLRTGYGECIDSFFAFGLFALARDVDFVPRALVDLFEPIVQEEARHILFLVNWAAYKRRQLPPLLRLVHVGRCLAAFTGAAYDRARSAGNVARGTGGGTGTVPAGSGNGPSGNGSGTTAGGNGTRGAAPPVSKGGNGPGACAPVSKDGFTATGARAIVEGLSVRSFVARCLEENDRRFAPYDPRLLRPRAVPALARAFLRVALLGRTRAA